MPNYLFDVKLFASLRLNAPDEDTARRLLAEALDAASINAGETRDGQTIVGEATVDADGGTEGRMEALDLIEIDGEAV